MANPSTMTPETWLDISVDMGVPGPNERAQRVMAKYSGNAVSAAPAPPSVTAEKVMVHTPRTEIPLTYNEQKAKAIAVGRAAGTMAARLAAAQAAAVSASIRNTSPSKGPKLRAVAAAKAAREDLPEILGGDVAQAAPVDLLNDSAPPSRPASAATAPPLSAVDSIPELDVRWVTRLEEASEDEDTRVFCVRFSHDSTLLAAGCGDGTVRVLHASSGRPAYALEHPQHTRDAAEYSAVRLPSTCLRWRPGGSGGRVLLAANAAGTIERWTVGPNPKCTGTLVEADNQVYAIDYSSDGLQIASAGKDTAVRVYDEARMELVATLGHSDAEMRRYEGMSGGAVGHTSRCFSVRFVPDDPNLLLSAGWDNTVRFWDVRAGAQVQSIAGPHVCGDALDVSGHELLVGSFRPNEQLQVFDIRSAQTINTVPWVGARRGAGCKLYAARFSKGSADAPPDLLAGAGVGALDGAGELRLFRRDGLDAIGRARLPRAIYALDMSANPSGDRIAITGGDDSVSVLEVPARPPAQPLS